MNPRLRAVARTTVRTLNTPLAKARASRAIERAERPVKLEIGGLEPRPGWLVTNVNATARNYLDATVRWPFEDEALELVYNDNVIEHISLEQGRTMLAEAYRCLRPGGVIRLVTPDLREHVDLYLGSSEAALGSPVAAAYRRLGLDVEHPIDLVRIPIASFGHHVGYLYDFDTLAAELRRAGFSDPVRYAPGDSGYAELKGLDQRAHEGGAQMAVEAVKAS